MLPTLANLIDLLRQDAERVRAECATRPTGNWHQTKGRPDNGVPDSMNVPHPLGAPAWTL
jgi:hypothetical protein